MPSRIVHVVDRVQVPVVVTTTPQLHVADYGASGDGASDDSVPIAAAINDASDGDTLVLERKTYRLQSGLAISKSLNIEGNGAKLLLYAPFPINNHLQFSSTYDAVLVEWSQAIAAGATSLTVAISPTSLPLGTLIYLELGNDPYDAAEVHYCAICTVLSNDGVSVGIDKLIPYDIVQGSKTHKIRKVINRVRNILIRDLVIDWIDGSTPDSNVMLDGCDNVVVENISGRFTAGIVVRGASSNISLRNINVDCPIIPGNAGGRVTTLEACENILVQNVHAMLDHGSPIFFAENWARGIRFNNITVDHLYNSFGGLCFHVTGGSFDVSVDDLRLRNRNLVELHSNGGAPGEIHFGSVDLLGDIRAMDLSLIDRLRWKNTIYHGPTLVSQTVTLQSGWTDHTVWFARGLLRRMWLYVSDKTGITSVYILNEGGLGIEVVASLQSGQWVALPQISLAGSTNPINTTPYPLKRLSIYSGSVTPGATLTVVAEVMHSDDRFA